MMKRSSIYGRLAKGISEREKAMGKGTAKTCSEEHKPKITKAEEIMKQLPGDGKDFRLEVRER